MAARSALYLLEAFGIQNPWMLWGLARGALGEWCTGCAGRGFVLESPCSNRERGRDTPCAREDGCAKCRRVCTFCRGTRLTKAPELLPEDFAQREDYERARLLFPGLEVGIGKRSDRDARAM